MSPAKHQPFLGRRRERKTRWRVRAADVFSRVLITVAGIGTIVAVSTVCIYLVVVVVPLFLSASVHKERAVVPPAGTVRAGDGLLAAAADEDQHMAWVLSRSGNLSLFRLETGASLLQRQLFDGGTPTTVSRPSSRAKSSSTGNKTIQVVIAFGFENGTIRLGTFDFRDSYPKRAKLPRQVLDQLNEEGDIATLGPGLARLTPQDQILLREFVIELPEPADPPSRSPVLLLDQTHQKDGSVVCSLTKDGKLRFNQITIVEPKDEDLPPSLELSSRELPLAEVDARPLPDHLVLSQEADQLFLIWNEGRFARYNLRDPAKAAVAERGSLLLQEGLKITALQQLIGRSTILIGDSSGTVSAWFLVTPKGSGTIDGAQMVRGHQLPGPAEAAVSSLDVSTRSRLVSIGYSNGQVRLYNVTSEKLVASFDTDAGEPVLAPILAPKTNGVVALTASRGRHWQFTPGHPEITLAALFGKVWYEGSEKPVHKWESSSGSDAYEPKLGMVPLIFGTLKASFYALLFGVPLALLAAIYTSEFMRPRARAVVKPVIEMMAGLPSVVLGFLAGLVFAQFVEDKVVTILCCFLLVPLTFAAVAQQVQLLPERISLTINRFRFLFFLISVVLGLLAALVVGPIVERVFFAGDLRNWLEDRNASSVGGWMLLFLPMGMLLTSLLMGGVVTPRLRRLSAPWGRRAAAHLDLLRFILGCLLALGFALGASLFLSWLGFDARGSYIDTYSQRNMLVAGFAMGFAIIPIIFTIADDALTAVPQHLRSGSLAAGATPWQTAVRIVIPTAMSGLFSAVMIGMGRAIGETMIVVMATGNTAVMDVNAFNGCRTLSANIAVEIPESERGGTLFATLFVCALLLFAMTFVLNTIAELVRIRFRRRTHQL